MPTHKKGKQKWRKNVEKKQSHLRFFHHWIHHVVRIFLFLGITSIAHCGIRHFETPPPRTHHSHQSMHVEGSFFYSLYWNIRRDHSSTTYAHVKWYDQKRIEKKKEKSSTTTTMAEAQATAVVSGNNSNRYALGIPFARIFRALFCMR